MVKLFTVSYLCLILFLPVTAIAGGEDQSSLYKITVEKAFEQVYKNVYQSLEDSAFYVIFEANIGKNLSRNAGKWGEDYNRNKFEEVKTMVICNPYYANQVLNLDPDLMALCPMGVTLLYKEGLTTVMFERLTSKTKNSPLADMMWEIENTIITAIENAVGL